MLVVRVEDIMVLVLLMYGSDDDTRKVGIGGSEVVTNGVEVIYSGCGCEGVVAIGDVVVGCDSHVYIVM